MLHTMREVVAATGVTSRAPMVTGARARPHDVGQRVILLTSATRRDAGAHRKVT